MANRKIFLLLLLILIIASFFRLYQITTTPPGLYPDEAMNGNNALQALRTGDFSALGGPASGWKVFYPENNGREGLFINIQALFLKAFNSPSQISSKETWEGKPWVLRLPSAIFGILTVLGIYFLTKELFDVKISFSPKPPQPSGHGLQPQVEVARRGQASESQDERSGLRKNEILALLSAFFLATSFWHINFSRIGFRAIMAPMFLTWSLYLLLKVLNQVKNKSEIRNLKSEIYSKRTWDLGLGTWCSAVLAGLLYGLGFYTYIAYRVTPVLIAFILLFHWFKNKDSPTRKKILVSSLLFLVSSFIVALPLGIYFLQHPADFFGRTSEISIFASPTPLKDFSLNVLKTLGMFNFAGDWNWRHNYAGAPELFWPVGILFILGVFIGIKSMVRSSKFEVRNNFGFWILFSWFILAMLPVVISNEGIPHALRSILMIPPVMILAGTGGVWLYESIKYQVSRLRTGFGGQASIKIFNFKMPFYILIFAFFIWLTFNAYYTYFVAWAKNPNVQGAFSANYVEIGREINKLPAGVPKYVVVQAGGVLVNSPPATTSSGEVGRGIPMPAQTVMFITDTFSQENQNAKNIYYVLPSEEKDIPPFAYKFNLQ